MIAPGGIVGNGVPFGVSQGAVDIHDSDLHHVIISKFFHRKTGVSTTLAVAASIDDVQLTFVDALSFTVGDTLSLDDETEFLAPSITAIVGNVVDIDQPLDSAYLVGDSVEQLVSNMAVDGSTTPVSFKLHSERGETWHIIRMLLGMVHSAAADDGKFGGIASLPKGVVLRYYNAISGEFRTMSNWKNNADLKLEMFDVVYTDKAAGGLFGTNSRLSYKKGAAAVPELAPNDYLELLIQGNLLALTSFKVKVQGHIQGG